MPTVISGDTGVSQVQANSVALGDIASGAIIETGGANIGYGTGSGGTVTQLTSKSTAVTLNKPTGQITMNNAALASVTSASFSLNNTLIGANDVVLVSGVGSTSQSYRIEALWVVAGACVIRVTNITAGSLSDALQINFAIIKGATA